jgi:hypothetical protein
MKQAKTKIKITKHAICRYRERMFDFTSTNEKIKSILKVIATEGKRIVYRPVGYGECIEVKHRGIAVVLINQKNESVVITCLGDERYRKWAKHQELFKIRGRILYPEPGFEDLKKENFR